MTDRIAMRAKCVNCDDAPRWDIFILCRACLEIWVNSHADGDARARIAREALLEAGR